MILAISILLNFIIIILFYKKKIRKFFLKSKISEISLSDVDEIFQLEKKSKNLKGPKTEAIIKSFCINSDNKIVGMTSDYEAWIISALSKKSKNIFEFGTCSGKTTFLMALNSSNETKITTLTLDPTLISELNQFQNDNKISQRNIFNETIYDKFLFSNQPEENKIKVLFQNSLFFETTNFIKKMDLIFIDGGHTYSVVKNDTEKAFEMIKNNGVILWHDYTPGKTSSYDVVRYLNKIAKKIKIFKIKNTSLCFYRKK